MLKYLDKAENEINTAEPVNVEPETLTVQLHDHQVRSPRCTGQFH
jgi:dystonin